MYTEMYMCCWTLAESHELAEQPNPQDSASRRVDVSGSTEASEPLLDSNNGEANNTESW